MTDYNEILENMKNHFRSLSGINPDDASDIGIRLKVVAGQIFALYSKCDWLLRQTFPQTADGQYLDMHAQQRAVERKSAYKALGEITFYRETESLSDISIPSGTICSTKGNNARRFITTEDAVLKAGELSVTVSAQAEATGKDYNAAANTITVMVTAPQGIISASNEVEFTGGCDVEDDDSLRERVKNTYSDISNGANTAFYREIALRHSEIGDANAIARKRGRGTVDVVVFSSSNTPPSQQVIDEVAQMLESAREVGTDVSVYSAEQIFTPIKIRVSAQVGHNISDVITSVADAVTEFINNIGIGKTLYLRDLHTLLRNLDGVENYKVVTPQNDYIVPASSKLVPINMIITELM
ncbi:MAG: baseplate J/gp47 family protein [Clostridia bacterium]|nr:baseplate J/gp47 family protein [Clostridia bacterium]